MQQRTGKLLSKPLTIGSSEPTSVMPRLAISRTTCSGSCPSGEPSSNPVKDWLYRSSNPIRYSDTHHPHTLLSHVVVHQQSGPPSCSHVLATPYEVLQPAQQSLPRDHHPLQRHTVLQGPC